MIEAFSVMLQVTSFRLTGKRIFRMSPLHHHFELVGWKEPQIIIRFWMGDDFELIAPHGIDNLPDALAASVRAARGIPQENSK